MKISSTFEQGIYVVVILALEKEHRPVKSSTMSALLQVSDSYLKKILRKLSRSGLIITSASRNGGYVLSRQADEISLKDIFTALGEGEMVFTQSDYTQRLFPGQAHAKEGEQKIRKTIEDGIGDFCSRLDTLKIADLLLDGAWQNGALVWEDRLSGDPADEQK